MKSLQKVYFPWAIVIAAACCIVAIAALAVNVYNTRYNTTNVQSGVSCTMTFKANGSPINAMDMTPSKGTLYTGSNQKSGTAKTNYTAKYKNATSSSYTTAWYITFNAASNNAYTGLLKLTTTSGSSKLNFQMVKTNNVSTESTVDCDLVLQ